MCFSVGCNGWSLKAWILDYTSLRRLEPKMEKLEWRWECSSHSGCRAECAITLFPKNSPDQLPHRMLMTWLGGGMVQQLGPWKEHLYGCNLQGCVGGLQGEGVMVVWRVWDHAEAATKHLQGNLTSSCGLVYMFLGQLLFYLWLGKKPLTFPHYSIFTALLAHLKSSLLFALCQCLLAVIS